MGIRKEVLVSTLDQALLSLANFLVGVFLIKNATKSDYGSYVLAYAIILFVVGVQNALINTQMIVLSPQKELHAQRRFCASLGIGQYLIFTPLILTCLFAIWVADHFDLFTIHNVSLIYAAGVAIFGVLLREFYRSYFFLILRPGLVLIVDICHVLALFTCLFVVKSLFPEMLHVLAIVSLGMASLASGLLAMAISKMPMRIGLREILSSLSESKVHGRWALGGVTITWIQDQSYVYLLSLLAGTAATAEASAARLFLSPIALLNAGFTRVLVPRWVHLRRDGDIVGIKRTAFKAKSVLIITIIAYVLTVLWVKDYVIRVFLTKEYMNIGLLIILWGLLFMIQSIRSNYASLLQVFHEFRNITLANLKSAITVIVLSIFMIAQYGPSGSIAAQLVGELILTMLMVKIFRKVAGNVDSPTK